MTREELIEVMARAVCLRELIIRNASSQRERDYDDDELKAIAEHEWVEWATSASDALAAIEAAGVRLVPVDPDDNQLAAGMESDSISHPWEALGVYRQMVSRSPYAPL
jgi:hypothetical protein